MKGSNIAQSVPALVEKNTIKTQKSRSHASCGVC